MIATMKTILEIETAIERLSAAQLAELVAWLEQFRVRRAVHPPVEAWLKRARGVARAGVTTAQVMTLTRGDE